MQKHIELNHTEPKGLFSLAWIWLLIIVCSSACNQKAGPETPTAPVGTEQQSTAPDQNKLVGRWLRPDGGYILEIRSATSDGKLDAGYFNPNSIHVAKAEWVEKDGKLYVLTELQDVNYPGSTYGLEYKVAQDKLVGSYYQAVEKSTFDVEFVREQSK